MAFNGPLKPRVQPAVNFLMLAEASTVSSRLIDRKTPPRVAFHTPKHPIRY